MGHYFGFWASLLTSFPHFVVSRVVGLLSRAEGEIRGGMQHPG